MIGLEPTIPYSQSTWGAAPLHPDELLSFERAGRRSNPCLLVFSQALYRLSYQPRQRKSPVSFA